MSKWILIDIATGRCFDVADTADSNIPFPVHESLEWCDITSLADAPARDWVAHKEQGVWVFTNPTPDALNPTVDELWQTLRGDRDAMLAQCDWTQLADAPLSPEAKAAWASHRQALRDLPANTVDPAAPVWPTPPAE